MPDRVEGVPGAPFADVLRVVLPDNASHVRAAEELGRTQPAIYQALHGQKGRPPSLTEANAHALARAAGYLVQVVLVPIETPTSRAPSPPRPRSKAPSATRPRRT